MDSHRPAIEPSNRPPGKRLLLAGYSWLTAGIVVSWIVFPWLAGDPTSGREDPNPAWVTVLSFVGLIAVLLGMASFIARLIVRRRPST